MTISKELFLAILSMDAYNRGYGAGISDGEGAMSNDFAVADAVRNAANDNTVVIERAS